MLDNSPTAGEVVKLLALAERLGWLAVVLPLNHIEVKEEHSNVFNLEFEQALNQASGLPKKEATVAEASEGSVRKPSPN